MNILKEYFPIPLIILGALLADASQALDEGIITFQIIAWSLVAVGGIGLARIVWQRVGWFDK